jgi:fused signal recognition particle receptor
VSILSWIELSYKNGELFFYIIPAFLLIMLLIVILTPDKKKEEVKPPVTPEVKTQRAPSKTIDLTRGSGPFKTLEIKLEEMPEPVVTPSKPATIEEGLSKTKDGFISKLKNLFKTSIVDASLIEELEEILYTSDMGVETVSWLMNEVNQNRSSFKSGDDVKNFIKEKIRDVLVRTHKDLPSNNLKPAVFLMVGVNGAGKTTTIGKIASMFVSQGKQCVLAAADTFRAAAVEQLTIWGERSGCPVISDREGADPASVAFNAVNSGKSKNADIVLIDTAGRLQNRVNLMEELSKINRVIGKAMEGAPHETILVIDANNGQNALSQAKQFSEAVNVTGIIVTKLDGTAKGGVLIGIAKELSLPVYFVGIGEKVEDMRPFDPQEYTEALFS